jgi:murein DD-endopeptidase MepM/ murein hydrolase activator NlpD
VQVVSSLFKRYLTPISIGVALLGLLLVIAGPIRSILEAANANSDAGSAESGSSNSASAQIAGSPALLERDLLAFTIIPERPRKEVITYMVKQGDTLFGLAQKFSLEPNTLFWANSDILHDNIHLLIPGVDLFILPENGVYHSSDGAASLQSIADKYKANVNDIINSSHNSLAGYAPSDVPPWGMRIIVPGGSREIVDWTPPVQAVTDTHTGTVTYGFMPGMRGSCSSGIAGGGGTGQWAIPLAPGTYTVTQGFYPWHSGIDLASVTGTAVYAADTGTVIFAGWNDWGYGNLVVLDHGNNWTTYYAHLNGINVRCGQSINRGQLVGWVGTTGNSTGPHLHFEMRWGHVPDNPANSIGF